MMYKMSFALHYDFDKVMLKRQAYSPIAHGDIENDLEKIRKGFIEIIEGRRALKIDDNLIDTVEIKDDNVLKK
jgi:hypothetical protein